MLVRVVFVLCDGAELLSLGAVKRNYETEATARSRTSLSSVSVARLDPWRRHRFLCRQRKVTTTIYRPVPAQCPRSSMVFYYGTLIFHLHCIDILTKSHGWTTDLTRDVPNLLCHSSA